MLEDADKKEQDQKVEETVEEAETRPMDETESQEARDEALEPVDIQAESERIIRWGAARASVIVMTPFLGSLALMANEVYMITRLSDLRGIELETGAIAGLIGSLGASFVGQTLFTIIPFPPLQVPAAVGITYAVGKAANAWLEAGRPKDLAEFKEMFEEARKEGSRRFKEFTENPNKNIPLGDETKKVMEKAAPLFDTVKEKADAAADKLGEVAGNMNGMAENITEMAAPFKEAAERWITAQTWEQLRRGEVVVPYTDLSAGLAEAMKDSEFTFKDCCYHGDNLLDITVEHEKYGTVTAQVEIEAMALNNTASFARFRIHDFAVADNKLGELLVRLLGTRIIMSLVNALFNMTVVNREDLICTFSGQSLTVDFTEVVNKSKLAQTKIKNFNLFDLVRLTGLVPEADGLHIKTHWGLQK